MKIYRNIYALMAIFIVGVACQNTETKVPISDDIEAKISDLISQMTLEEKVSMIHASSSFTSGGVERLGIPEMVMSDGPHGVRHEHGRDWDKDQNVYDSSTYLPVGTALAATWNPDLGYQFGTVLGSEANFRGKDMILGPGLNIIRSPLNGRNFEYLTEDPYLNSRMVVGYVKGVQEQGVAACAKHYIANSLEFEREKVNVEMSERALREIYLPGFKAAVQEGKVHTIMAAYNKFRGDYCAESELLLDEILKAELGFDGLVVSDWNAVKSTMEGVKAGIDIEMGTDLTMPSNARDYSKFHLGDTLIGLVQNGVVEESLIDAKVERILRVMFRINKFGERKPGAYNTEKHQNIARAIANEAITLLKNDGILPLDRKDQEKIAVVGANATWKHAGAGGSSQVKAYYEITPKQGLETLLGEWVQVEHAQGYEVTKEGASNADLIAEAVEKVKNADAAIYFGGFVHGYSDEWGDNVFDAEALDKPDMQLPFGQRELIEAILDANPNTIIVLMGGGPVDMRGWGDRAKAIVQAWYPGMEGGTAIAEVLYGEINPSGKLPMTFPVKLDDSPAHALAKYPTAEGLLVEHTEDIYVGYRYFDTYDVEPAYAFGHGLSYTTFEYSGLEVNQVNDKVEVKLNVKNIGDRDGAEVVQIYVKDDQSNLPRPEKELKAFEKVNIKAGESVMVNLELSQDAFKYFDDSKMDWVLESGSFQILAGSSAVDIRQQASISL
ncbi:MAG: glycoside hydrolase family 3 C-terminal domain-containing protein [Cyclobacteriaceae bacterium]